MQKHHYRDLFCLDLQMLDEWRQLPPYPVPASTSGMFIGWTMLVHNSKAYLFTGRPQVDILDLVAEKWGSIMTKMKNAQDRWPYGGNSLINYTTQLIDGKLYVIGGVILGASSAATC